MVLKSNPSIILLCSFLPSDYIIEEKTAVLQKREHEGFGFVLRGAKAETPIEEFTPTPAFPALQYLESVDVEGVAWRAGLRTGDFLIEVNGVNVVKVGHKQVVSLIRQGGNHLVMKVVSVSRKPESEEVVRKKAPPPPKRAPSTTLTLRSKSMTAELEELGKRRMICPFLVRIFPCNGGHVALVACQAAGDAEGPILLEPRSTMQLWCTRGWFCRDRLFMAGTGQESDVLRAPTESIGRARGSHSRHCLLPWLMLLLFVFMFLLCKKCGDVYRCACWPWRRGCAWQTPVLPGRRRT
uniref:SH3 and multiple ankyrin repeat domains 3 n=1 Tax=Buteo japonicus TaxID=224669 RepID=A0A8C0B890_9AVES